MPEQMVRTNGIEIWCEDRGDPADPPILLVMGATASALRWRGAFCDELAARARHVIRFDNRDAGRSTCFDFAVQPYALSDMAGDAVGLMDALSISSAHVVGMSLGGMIAQTLAIERPDRVRTLTSIASSPTGAGGAPGGSADDLPGPTDRAGAETARMLQPPPDTRKGRIDQSVALQRTLAGSRYPFDEAAEREVVGREIDRARSFDARNNHVLVVATAGDRRPALANVAVPTLVVHGTEDPIFPLAHGIATAELIAGAHLLSLDGVGHELPPAAWPGVINAIVELTEKA